MTIRNASVVELGTPDLATVLGIHPYVAEMIEELVMAKGQHIYGRFRLTRMDDNRICIEKEFLPMATGCQCILCKQIHANDRVLQDEAALLVIARNASLALANARKHREEEKCE